MVSIVIERRSNADSLPTEHQVRGTINFYMLVFVTESGDVTARVSTDEDAFARCHMFRCLCLSPEASFSLPLCVLVKPDRTRTVDGTGGMYDARGTCNPALSH